MILRPTLSRAVACAAAAWALAASAAGPAAPARAPARAAPAATAAVHGLIVQLRDAPSHLALARERAQARDAAAATRARREGERWQRLVAELRSDDAVLRELPAWAHQAPQRDPVGSSAQLLRFAQPLTAAQAERVAERLAVRPDVAWVAANVRERRLALATNPPFDPYYPGLAGQWWLQQVQGSNASPLEGRLRGVAGFLPAWLGSTTGSAAAVVAVLDTGITCHPDLGNLTPDCIGGAILPGYDFVADWDPATHRGYANDGNGRDPDPRDPGDWVSAGDRAADPARYSNCEIQDSSWHGSTIAGLIAARTDNGIGVAATNWYGRIVPVRVAGKCGAEVADIIDGMRWAVGLAVCKVSDGLGGCTEFVPANANPARIVNISFGGDAACNGAYQDAIDEVRAAPGGGAVVVAAAGNNWAAPSRPASCQRVLGVAALNRDGFKTNYSNFGAALALATTGGDDGDGAWGRALGSNSLADSGILSIGNSAATVPADCTLAGADCYYYHYGTSFSAPIVAGAVSLMLSVNPALTVGQIEQGLARSARPHVRSSVAGFNVCSNANPGRCLCTTSTCGAGILDVEQALLFAASPSTYVAPSAQAAQLDSPELRAAVASGPDRPANPTTTPPPPPPASGGGGGVMSGAWLLALALAAWAVRRRV